MRVLHHLPLSPFSRKVRLALGEKSLPFKLVVEKVWVRRPEFLAVNPAGQVPVLVEDDGTTVADSWAICEYLEDTHPEPRLTGPTPVERAEMRRLVAWFDLKFDREVTRNLLFEKMTKRYYGCGEPDSDRIRAGRANIRYQLDYIEYLVDRRKWLAGETLSYADLAAAAHLSVLDYIGDVPWRDHGAAHDWYAKLKSRPSFRPLLQDHVAGAPPVKHYADLDF